ncbi:hypothetical protein [Azospirillum doebereinerae]
MHGSLRLAPLPLRERGWGEGEPASAGRIHSLFPPSAEHPSSQPANPSDTSGVLRDSPRKGRRAMPASL